MDKLEDRAREIYGSPSSWSQEEIDEAGAAIGERLGYLLMNQSPPPIPSLLPPPTPSTEIKLGYDYCVLVWKHIDTFPPEPRVSLRELRTTISQFGQSNLASRMEDCFTVVRSS